MSYADRNDVLARAGALQDAWGAQTKPSLGDLDTFISQSQAEVDAFIASRGFPVPVTDSVASAALAGIVADKALLLALRATWPGGSGPQAVSDLIRDVEARVSVYDSEIAKGDLPALLYLASTAAAKIEGGADDFWTQDGQTYDEWLVLNPWVQTWMPDPWGIPASMQPAFRRDERF